MATYAIGDVQGCYKQLLELLAHIGFNPKQDTLWFAGDLVNRGPDSLSTLRFIKNLNEKAIAVLGNHDLSLLAYSLGAIKAKKSDTFQSIVDAPDGVELLEWLRTLPLMHVDQSKGFTLCHAGIFPLWSIEQAYQLNLEVCTLLRGEGFKEFMFHMFGKKPDRWSDSLTGYDRFRFIVNAFTRMRFCRQDASLDFDCKSSLDKAPKGSIPWYEYPNPAWQQSHIIFGHWAALNGECHQEGLYALDTGCVWGRSLTALCLETRERFSIECRFPTT